jgi:hypothetical protein
LNGGIAAICTFAAMPCLAASRIGQAGRGIDEREKPTDEESERQEGKIEKRVSKSSESFAAGVSRGLRPAAKSARKIAQTVCNLQVIARFADHRVQPPHTLGYWANS